MAGLAAAIGFAIWAPAWASSLNQASSAGTGRDTSSQIVDPVGLERALGVDIRFQSLRFNRVGGGWDVELVVSNCSSHHLSGPLWLEFEAASSNARLHNREENGCLGEPMDPLDLSETLAAEGLAPAACARPVRLALVPLEGRGRGSLRLVTRLSRAPPASPSNLFDLSDLSDPSYFPSVTTPSPVVLRTNILETGLGLPLATLAFAVSVPETLPRPSLSFLFGFATQETDMPHPF